MAKKKKNDNLIVEFKENINNLHRDGYVALPRARNVSLGSDIPEMKTACGSGDPSNSYASSGIEIAVSIDGVGAKDRGYIQWGHGNTLPNQIALFTSMLPYTAAGVKFNTDVANGLGPEPKYRYSYISGGSVVTKEIDYHAAGEFLNQRISEARVELLKLYTETKRTASIDSKSLEAKKIVEDIEAQLQKRIQDTEKELKVWEQTMTFLNQFLKDNNLSHIFLELFCDMAHMGICFPEFELEAQRNVKNTKVWKPKITRINHRSCLITRLEKMDDEGKINHVYVSNSWRREAEDLSTEDQKIHAIPALHEDNPVGSLEKAVVDARLNNVSINSRPTRFVLPCSYSTMGRPYYPQPSWWTVFGGKIYNYANTIISDRVTRRNNANMWGKIIYVHTKYLEYLYSQDGGADEAKRKKINDEIEAQVDMFLKNKENNGKTLFTHTFTLPDGKEAEAVRIVDVPNANSNEATSNRTELEEVASIIFFALEIHPHLIGASPGSNSSSGGTYQREMYEMKKLMMAPTQQIVLNALRTMSEFNGLDKNLVWRIKSMTLTTLDRNKSGLEETKV